MNSLATNVFLQDQDITSQIPTYDCDKWQSLVIDSKGLVVEMPTNNETITLAWYPQQDSDPLLMSLLAKAIEIYPEQILSFDKLDFNVGNDVQLRDTEFGRCHNAIMSSSYGSVPEYSEHLQCMVHYSPFCPKNTIYLLPTPQNCGVFARRSCGVAEDENVLTPTYEYALGLIYPESVLCVYCHIKQTTLDSILELA